MSSHLQYIESVKVSRDSMRKVENDYFHEMLTLQERLKAGMDKGDKYKAKYLADEDLFTRFWANFRKVVKRLAEATINYKKTSCDREVLDKILQENAVW